MKKSLLAASLLCTALTAQAEPGVFLGLTLQLGGNFSAREVGLTAKLVSSRHEDRAVVGGGISIYPFGSGPTRIGADIGAGLQGRNAGALVGYDLLLNRPTLSIGHVNTVRPAQAPAPLPPT